MMTLLVCAAGAALKHDADWTATGSSSTVDRAVARPMSLLPMLVISLAQILIAFNVNALRISVGGIVASFETSPSIVGTAIVTHLLFIAALVMPGAKIGAIWARDSFSGPRCRCSVRRWL
jgi:hypothetical protein